MKRLTLFCFLLSVFCAQARITKFHNIYTPDGFHVLNTKVDSSGTNVTLKWLTDTNSPHYKLWRDGREIAEVSNTNEYTDSGALSNYVHTYNVTTAYRDAGRHVATLSRFETNLAAGELDYVKDQVIVSNSWYLVATNKILKVTTPGLAVRTSNTFTNDYRTNACRIAYLTTTEGGGGGGEDTKTHKLYVLFDNVNRIVINEVDPDTLAYTTVVSNISATGTATTKGLCVGGAFLFVGISDVNHSYIYKYDLTDNFSVTTNQLADLALLTTIEYASDNVLAVGQDSGGLNWGARIAADDLTYDDVIGVGPAFGSARTIGDEIALNGGHFWAAYTNGGVSFFPNTDDSFAGYDPEEYNYVSSDFTNGLSVQNAGDYVWALFGTNAQNYSRQVLFTPTSGSASPGTNYLQPVHEYTGAAGGGYVSQVTSDPTNDSMFYVAYPAAPTKLGLWRETPVEDLVAPNVAFLNPPYNAFVSGTTNVTVRVWDNHELSHVIFMADRFGQWVEYHTAYLSGTNSTNTAAWDTTTFPNGFVSILAQAFDASGLWSYTQSAVTVSNYNPNPGITAWASNVAHAVASTGGADAQTITLAGSNLVLGGIYAGTVNFAGTNIASAPGQSASQDPNYDAWLAMYNTNGVRQWIATFTNAFDARVTSVAVDSDLNVFAAGFFSGTLNMGGTNIVAATGLDFRDTDPFVAKFNSSGVHQWSKRMGGLNGNYGRKVLVDSGGNVYLGGEFYNVANFGSTNVTSAGGLEIYLVKMSSSGAFTWQAIVAGTGPDNLYDMAVDTNDNVYICGVTQGDLNFGNGSVANHGAAGTADGYIACYNSSGSNVWAMTVGGSANDTAYSLAVHGTNLFAIGTCRSNITLGSATYAAAPNNDVLWMARIPLATGTIVQSRVISYNSTTSGGGIAPRSMAIDSDGNLVIVGSITGEFDFGNGQLTAGTGNIFIAKYDSNFQFVWAKRIHVPLTGNFITEAVVDSSRTIYGVGRWKGTGTFDGFPLSSVSGAFDGYLFKSSP